MRTGAVADGCASTDGRSLVAGFVNVEGFVLGELPFTWKPTGRAPGFAFVVFVFFILNRFWTQPGRQRGGWNDANGVDIDER